jgi:hypothetical protein
LKHGIFPGVNDYRIAELLAAVVVLAGLSLIVLSWVVFVGAGGWQRGGVETLIPAYFPYQE